VTTLEAVRVPNKRRNNANRGCESTHTGCECIVEDLIELVEAVRLLIEAMESVIRGLETLAKAVKGLEQALRMPIEEVRVKQRPRKCELRSSGHVFPAEAVGMTVNAVRLSIEAAVRF
jgi:hypothetical protein